MKSATLLLFLLAMIAMLCNSVSAESTPEFLAVGTELETRAAPGPVASAAFDATLNLLVKDHTDIVLKTYADVCADAKLTTEIDAKLRVEISGLIKFNFGLGTRLSSVLRSSIKTAVRNEIDFELKTHFQANLRANLAAIINKRCPKHDAACIKLQSKNIVKDAVKFTTKATAKVSKQVDAKLEAKIRTAIDIEVRKFSIDLWLVKINVTGDLDISHDVSLRFKGAAGISAKACADISAKQVSQIRTICSA
ncbi:hypothetical protein BGZ72_009206 [Mortierella alpina]|nr:hypothetical protein BGZ72_009206 [Mortierella alpina]